MDAGDFAALGIGAAQEKVYAALVGRPGCTPAELRGGAAEGLPENIAEIIAELADMGLVTCVPAVDGAPPRFVPVSPDVALNMLILEREEELKRARRTEGALLDRFRAVHRHGAEQRLVEVIRGADAVRQRVNQLQRNTRRQVRILGAYVLELDADLVERQLLDQGVVYRAVCDPAALDGEGRRRLAALAASGEQIRTAPDMPTTLLLCDDSFGLLPLCDAEPGSAVLVHPSMLLTALSALFEEIWRHAGGPFAPAPGPEGAGLAEDDRRLLALLAAGAKDESIGRRLGVSARTVHRRVQELMTRLGVTNRLQLGAEAARRGWLT